MYPRYNTQTWRFMKDDLFYMHKRHAINRYILMGILVYLLIFKWTRTRYFFREVRLWPFNNEYKFVSPKNTAIIMGTCTLLFQYFAPCLHVQFIQWTELTFPLLLVTLTNLSGQGKLMVFALYEFCWTEPALAYPMDLEVVIFSFAGFLASTILIFKLMTDDSIAEEAYRLELTKITKKNDDHKS